MRCTTGRSARGDARVLWARRMRRRALGRTGLQTTELGLGTWGLSGDAYGAVTEAESARVVERALQLGISLFETADSYAHGEVERRLAGLLPPAPATVVVTKVGTDREAVPPRKRFDPAYVAAAVERSAERLGRSTLDVVLLHNPSARAIAKGEATRVLRDLTAKGALRSWGVSVGDEETGRAALAEGAPVVEVAYNTFHRRTLRALLPEVKERGAGVLARSVLAHGLLCGHWSADKRFPEGDHRADRWTPDELRLRIRHLDALRPVVGNAVLTLRSGALRFVLEEPAVSCAVLGARSVVQLDQLVREAGREPPYLGEDKLAALARRLDDLRVEA